MTKVSLHQNFSDLINSSAMATASSSSCEHSSPENVDFCKSLEALVIGTLRRLYDKESAASAVEFLEGCVEGVPPSGGDAWRQHEAMVAAGMCREGERHKNRNRYRDGQIRNSFGSQIG